MSGKDPPGNAASFRRSQSFRADLKGPTNTVERKRNRARFPRSASRSSSHTLDFGDNHDRGGGGAVRLLNRGEATSASWDDDMITPAGATDEFWLDQLAAVDTARESHGGDGRGRRRLGHQEPAGSQGGVPISAATNKRQKPGQKLGRNMKANLPVVRERLYQGSVRPASVLERGARNGSIDALRDYFR